MQYKTVITATSAVALVAALGAGGTYALSGTESTTTLDKTNTVTVAGQKALDGRIVAGRTQSKYHPLPWVGTKITGTTCPSGLPARAGATLTCTAKDTSGKAVTIRVKVTAAAGSSVTWSFSR